MYRIECNVEGDFTLTFPCFGAFGPYADKRTYLRSAEGLPPDVVVDTTSPRYRYLGEPPLSGVIRRMTPEEVAAARRAAAGFRAYCRAVAGGCSPGYCLAIAAEAATGEYRD